MKPFPPVIYSLFETLSGCNYINSHARFTWAIDHKLYFRSETDNRFRIENLVGWVCMRIILKEKKKNPGALQPFKASHLICWVWFLMKISGENSRQDQRWPRRVERWSPAEQRKGAGTQVGGRPLPQSGRVISNPLLSFSGPQSQRPVKQGMISSRPFLLSNF